VSEQYRSTSRRGRKLTLKARAERQAETRRRITQAAVELHERVGPLATTISSIAERAGVERLTVYRHFPDEPSLFRACTEHYFVSHPPPDPSLWIPIEDPLERLEHGLAELYLYWDETEQMFSSVLRDYEVAPERVGMGAVTYMRQAAEVLQDGWDVRGRRRQLLLAAIGHAVHFGTWKSLVRIEGLSEQDAVFLMTTLVKGVADTGQPLPRRRRQARGRLISRISRT
jgi:AcrR family transcriptional regulator